MSEISLYIDEDVRLMLAEILRNRGYNAAHVLELNREGKSDEEQFEYAVKHGMAILTYNIGDFSILYKAYAEGNKTHYGIIVSEQLPFSELLRRALKFLSSNTAESLLNQFVWLRDYK